MNAIEIIGLCKNFTGKRMTKIEALKGLNLEVARGEVFGFLGPNGAGKSTTIKLLMGLLKPTTGLSRIMGVESSQTLSRTNVGFLPENPAFYDYLSAEEYIKFVGSQFGMEANLLATRTEEVLKRMDLWEARKRHMRGYSKGMVQRVGLAQTLVHDPDVYVLDEPMSGLDPIGRALVKDIILDLKKQGKCVFFSTHITDDVEKVCDRVGVINNGQLLVVDSVTNILQRGIEGYSVLTISPEGVQEENYVGKDELQFFIQRSLQNNQSIEKIESRSKDMEAFFLEIVAR
ncbi:MAG: ABC transporter ATP-binding protein [Desulfuromonadaceae bacterium]|nr:ABC transporter ATP-binding protein [Desulfuromonadaceae bacterium]MDD2854096.1 ABC transporter ATP-binding protein [Desulfuromonadaceae bacterium]